MARFLLAKEGALEGLTIRLDEDEEWRIGRDPDVSSVVIEDPTVSREHALIIYRDGEYFLQNASQVNETTVNDEPIEEERLLEEGDTIGIGDIKLTFTEHEPQMKEESPTLFGNEDELDSLSFAGSGQSLWLMKIISGSNVGGEFGIEADSSYIIGKDPMEADIVLHDLSVSKRHAKISCSPEGTVTIEDLGSKNGTVVNNRMIEQPKELGSQDLITIGSSSCLIIKREDARETIVSMPILEPEEEVIEEVTTKNWKEMIIPYRHLALAGLLGFIVVFSAFGTLSLFKSSDVVVVKKDETKEIKKTLEQFPEVEFSFNNVNGKLFLLGNVMSSIDHKELTYLLSSLPYIRSLDDNIVIDEDVWESFNPLLAKNPNWRSVNISSIKPGDFVIRGYLGSTDELSNLNDYITINFPYLDRLKNEVIVEKTLEMQIQGLLISKGFGTVTFQLTNGELVLAGRVEEGEEKPFNKMLTTLKKVDGVRSVKNYVIFSTTGTASINISAQYKVTGRASKNDESAFVVINGQILGVGSTLEGMIVQNVGENALFLEKDGIKFKINYNP